MKKPAKFEDIVRFLKHRFSVDTERTIYAEGALIMPPGTRLMAEKIQAGEGIQ